MVRPKKHLGQHFLTDQGIAKRIVDILPDGPEGTVIEIGPGKGVLTEYLLEKEIRSFKAIEIDEESVDYLKHKWPELGSSIIQEDFLKLSMEQFDAKYISIIGNFPYNISSQIFFKVIENKERVHKVICMIQKEVAERLCSPPGSKRYGILSVFLQAYYHTQFHFNVKPGSFFPPPKVSSSVISLTRNNVSALDCDEKLFFRVVKSTFNQRRKTIRNSLKTILLNLDGEFEMLSKRPEQLSVSEFVELTNWVQSRL